MNPPFRVRREWLEHIRAQAIECEARRPQTRKPRTTGTISEAACLYLRAIVDVVGPSVCAEIGTFIGTSALVLASTGARVYTCDKDNDVLPASDGITPFGKTTSTTMLRSLVQRQSSVDLWFFDGRIQAEDLPLIAELSHRRTVYAFDDYEGREKGVINAERLKPRLQKGYRLIPPPARVLNLESTTTIALLVP